jgi:RNA polymerase sigma factor (TIGR02999 family)
MMSVPDSTKEVTDLLVAYGQGDAEALERLIPLVYSELHRRAGYYLRAERSDHTLQPTALVNEAFLRLVDQNISWQNRAHFFGVAAQVMRRILVDHARAHNTEKRGGQARKLSLDEAIAVGNERPVDLIALDEALERLAQMDAEKCRLVELRYFAGLSVEETAEAMGMSVATVMRHWSMAKAWLRKQMGEQGA